MGKARASGYTLCVRVSARVHLDLPLATNVRRNEPNALNLCTSTQRAVWPIFVVVLGAGCKSRHLDALKAISEKVDYSHFGLCLS
jgi:hypothetical protein